MRYPMMKKHNGSEVAEATATGVYMSWIDEHPRTHGNHRSGHRAFTAALVRTDAVESVRPQCATIIREGDHG